MADVDLSQLAIDRESMPPARSRSRLLTRYVLPGAVILGFAVLVVWALRDLVLPPRPVTVVPVMATQAAGQPEGSILFHAAGWIEPRPTPVRAAALASGVVERLLVVEDQPVKKGEPIADLIKDDAQLAYQGVAAELKLREAEKSEAEAALAAATKRLEQPVHLQAELYQADSALAKVQTEVATLPTDKQAAEAALKFAQSDFDGKIAAKGAVSGRAVDAARSQLDSARAFVDELSQRKTSLEAESAALVKRRDALQVQLELLADEINARDQAAAQVQAAAARVRQAQVALEEAKLRLDRMTVRSPIDGRVYQLIAHPGARIGSGMTQMAGHDGSTIVTLYQPESLQVRVDVRFEDIPKVGLGQSARIECAAMSEPVIGRVLYVNPEADIQKNTLEVKVGLDSPPSVLKPEMLVDATFLSQSQEDAGQGGERSVPLRVFLSKSFIQQDDTGSYVWLADQTTGRARRLPVEKGIEGSNGMAEVIGELSISSRIIASNIEGLRDGQRIQVTGEAEP